MTPSTSRATEERIGEFGEALGQAERATDELRELAHGTLPTVLTHGGLRAGVEALAGRMPLPADGGTLVAAAIPLAG